MSAYPSLADHIAKLRRDIEVVQVLLDGVLANVNAISAQVGFTSAVPAIPSYQRGDGPVHPVKATPAEAERASAKAPANASALTGVSIPVAERPSVSGNLIPSEGAGGADRDAARCTTHLPASVPRVGSPAPFTMLDAARQAKPPTSATVQPKTRSEALQIVSNAIDAKPVQTAPVVVRTAQPKPKPQHPTFRHTPSRNLPVTAKEEEMIARYIAEKGVTRCPPAAVDVTTAEFSADDKAAIAAHQRDMDAAYESSMEKWLRSSKRGTKAAKKLAAVRQ